MSAFSCAQTSCRLSKRAARSAAILFGQESSLHRFDLDSVLAKLSILTSSWELEQDLRLAIYFAIYGEYWNTAKVYYKCNYVTMVTYVHNDLLPCKVYKTMIAWKLRKAKHKKTSQACLKPQAQRLHKSMHITHCWNGSWMIAVPEFS